jgi:DNA repair protein RadC
VEHRIATFKNFVGELSVNYRRTSLASIKISSSASATDFMIPFFDNIMDDHEEVKVLHLNRNGCIVNVHHVTKGSDSECLVPIKDIMRQALLIKTNAIILFHNHPSGNLKASKLDIEVSKKLKKAANLFEISLLDSVILTRESYTSLADEGLL